MKDQKVSIITATYNAARFIEETIEHVVAQTHTNWELLITDDASTDNTWSILQKWAAADPRIRIFQQSENKGAGIARNISLNHATGRYIAFCDSDDYWRADKLEKQLQFMHDKKCAICYSSYVVVDESGNEIGHVKCPDTTSSKDIKYDDSMGMLTLIYDAQQLQIQQFPHLRKRQDWGMKICLLNNNKTTAYGQNEYLAFYRYHKSSLSRNKFALIKYNIAVYEKVLGYNWLKARLVFACFFLPKYCMKKLRIKLNNICNTK